MLSRVSRGIVHDCMKLMSKYHDEGALAWHCAWVINRSASRFLQRRIASRKAYPGGTSLCSNQSTAGSYIFDGVVRSTETAQPTSPGKKFTKACARDVFCCMPHFFNVLRDDLGPATSRAERSVTRAIAGQQRNTYANFYTKYAKHNIWFMIFYAGRGMIIHMSGLKAGGNS